MKSLVLYLFMITLIFPACTVFFSDYDLIRGYYWMSKYDDDPTNFYTGIYYNSNEAKVFLSVGENTVLFYTDRFVDSVLGDSNLGISITNYYSNTFMCNYALDPAAESITFTETSTTTNWDITPAQYEYHLSRWILELKREEIDGTNTNVIELSFVRRK